MTSRLQPLNWTKDQFDNLTNATAEALKFHHRTITLNFGKKIGDVTITTDEAFILVQELSPAFSQPPRVYPENREGAEP